jgi:hypothetical protein
VEEDARDERIPQPITETDEVPRVGVAGRRAGLDLDPDHVSATELTQDVELEAALLLADVVQPRP